MLDKFIHKVLRIPYTLAVYEKRRVKKPKATLVFLHGVGASGAAWDEVVKGLKDDAVDVFVVDLLGFGKSPKPEWAQYKASMQSAALAKTLLASRVSGHITVVGHSMGALIAVEFAKRYPAFVSGLVLCSPPLYDDKTSKYLPERDSQLKYAYRLATNYPEQLVKMSEFARKYGLVGGAFNITTDTVDDYISALKSAIINQTSLRDIAALKMPITITYGIFDPFIVSSHFKALAKKQENIHVRSFMGAHEIEGRYVPLVIDAIKKQVSIAPR